MLNFCCKFKFILVRERTLHKKWTIWNTW